MFAFLAPLRALLLHGLSGLGALLLGLAAPAIAAETPGVPAGTPLWDFQTGDAIWSPPTHDRGILYVGSDDGHLYALDTAKRALKWKFATGGKLRSKPAIAGDLVIAASDDGYLYALDHMTGAERWRFSLESQDLHRREPALSNPYYDFLHSSPLVHDGHVYIGSLSGTLFVVEATSGKAAWRFGTSDAIRGTPVIANGHVYFGGWDDHVYAINLATRQQSWRSDTGGIVQSTPAVDAKRLIIGSRSAKLVAFDPASGAELWSQTVPEGSWVESSALLHDERFYIGSSDLLTLSAHAAEDGRQLWSFPTGGWSWATPVHDKGTLYIGAISAFPHYFEGVTLARGFFAVDAETGQEKWRFTPPKIQGKINGYVTGGVAVAPAIAEGIVYIATLDGRIHALKQ
ncbi:outer membrane protein assembly factor BamB family protein [Sphingopyxis sp. MWB1]|uniref:outer membrane protein assembly factor BamB family protein n=1 Tax=Sphingopyxis sp. MWB1 TaxID=1537715 RepID=UPI00068B3AC8|nr:PQQ-binding-like beta-propeller repeat protein [Sphingopyxis sp. MWB1]